MSEYIEKKAVTDWLDQSIEDYRGEKEKEGTSLVDRVSLGSRVAMLEETKTFINSLPTQEVTPSGDKPEPDLEAEIEERANQVSCCDFCHASEVEDRVRWCADQFRYFYNLNPKHK